MLLFHHDTTGPDPHTALSPAQMQAEMEKWGQWAAGLATQGRLIQSYGLQPSGRTIRGQERVVTDGPYTEGKEIIVSYTLLYATDLAEAMQVALTCPSSDFLGRIVEVRPVLDFSQEPPAA